MPGNDGTGPMGEGPAGRRMGPCGDPKEETEVTEGVDAGSPENQSDAYGVGRGGKPRGCGRGNCGGHQNRGHCGEDKGQHNGHGRMRRCCEES